MKPLDQLSDEELEQAFEVAKHDLYTAADNEPNSDWHELCFAGTAALMLEIVKRSHNGKSC